MTSNPHFTAKNDRINLGHGSIVDAESDIIVIPVSKNGTMSDRSKDILERLDITPPN